MIYEVNDSAPIQPDVSCVRGGIGGSGHIRFIDQQLIADELPVPVPAYRH